MAGNKILFSCLGKGNMPALTSKHVLDILNFRNRIINYILELRLYKRKKSVNCTSVFQSLISTISIFWTWMQGSCLNDLYSYHSKLLVAVKKKQPVFICSQYWYTTVQNLVGKNSDWIPFTYRNKKWAKK